MAGMALAGIFSDRQVKAEEFPILSEEKGKLSIDTIVALTSRAREQEGLGALNVDSKLQKIAERKAADMAEKGYFSHTGPEGKKIGDWAKESGYKFGIFGENLAEGFEDEEDVLRAWMASPSHRKNILEPKYENIGIGIAKGEYRGKQVLFVAAFYASPKKRFLGALF